MAKERTVVVGAGLAGLAAALDLARAGHAVTVLEKAAEVGGRARSRNASGFVFNLGPHALYHGPARAYLRELAVPFTGSYQPGGHLLRAGKRHTMPTGPLSLLTTGMLTFGGRLEATRFLSSLPTLDAAAFASVSWEAWLRERVLHEDVREMLRAFARLATYTSDPGLSAQAALGQLQLGVRGSVLYLDGGWQTLVAGLRARAHESGVEVRTRAAVAAIAPGPEPTVRLADGRLLLGDSVILATDPATAARLVPESASLRRAADRAVPVRAASLDLGLRRLPRPEARFALGVDRPLYFSVHSTSAKLAPPGGALVHAAMYLGAGSPSDPQAVEQELLALVESLQPGFGGETVVRRFVPDFVVSSAVVTAESGGYRGRPDVRVEDAPGLFVAGDWVGPEGQLADAALASARSAVDAITGRVRAARAA